MNADTLNALKLTGMGMTAIFLVMLVIYFVVHLMLKLSNRKKPDEAKPNDQVAATQLK